MQDVRRVRCVVGAAEGLKPPPQPTSPHLVTNEPRAVSVRLLRPLECLVQLLRLRKRHPADLPAPRVRRACAVSNCFQSEMGDKCISDRAGTLMSCCGRAGLTASQPLFSVPRTDPAYRTPCTLSDVQLRAASAVLAPSVGQTWMQRCTGAVACVWVRFCPAPPQMVPTPTHRHRITTLNAHALLCYKAVSMMTDPRRCVGNCAVREPAGSCGTRGRCEGR